MNRSGCSSGKGSWGPTASPSAQQRAPRPPARRSRRRSAPRPAQFVREVRGELRKVAWPTRSEIVNYSIIVLVTLVVLTAFIAVLDWIFGEAVL